MTCPPIDRGQAEQFIALLGKTANTARLRAFAHKKNPRKFHPETCPDGIRARSGGFNLTTAHRWQNEERGVYLVTGHGGDSDASITTCPALFAEWDDRPVDEQLVAWQRFGLPEPSITVLTGGKSAHIYWLLAEPLPPDEWRPLQAALIDLTGCDTTIRNPSRVMRLPGAWYIGADGQPTEQTTIHSAPGHRYTLEQVLSWFPAQSAEAPQGIPLDDDTSWAHTTNLDGTFPPRPLEQIREALAHIPSRVAGTNTYPTYRNILWGLIRACEEAGSDRETAIALMESHSPEGWDIRQVASSGGDHIAAATFWHHARANGWRPAQESPTGNDPTPGSTPAGGDQQGQQGQQGVPGRGQGSQERKGGQGADGPPAPLPLDQIRQQLRELVSSGASRQELETARIDLSIAGDLNPATLRDLLASIEREHEAAERIQHEARRHAIAADRQDIARALTLDYLLPQPLADALRTRTRYLPADDIATAAAFLVGISGTIRLGSEITASQAADYRVPLNLYGALVARSGAKKSPLSRLVVSAPTERIRLDLARDHTRAVNNWQEQNRGLKVSERSDPPHAIYLSISDATAEALAHQLQIQEERGLGLLLHRDELAALFGSLNQYRGGRGSDSEQLLEAYDGGAFRSLRVAAGIRAYSRCHLSIWGTIQPGVLEALVADGDASGLWARFLFVPLPERVVPLADDDDPEETAAAQAAADTLQLIAERLYRQPRASLSLSPDGRRAFNLYEARCQGDALRANLPAQGALLAKGPGKVLRIAGLLHLLAEAVGSPQPTTVGADNIDRAAALIDHLNDWTLGLHEAVAGGETTDLMRLVHRVGTANNGQPIAWRDVAQRLSRVQRREVDSAAAGAAADALAFLGVGEVTRTSRGAWHYVATGALV
jgi:hypothetical protein